MKSRFKIFLTLAVVGGMMLSCRNDDNDHITYVNNEIFNMMEEVYLWNEELPDYLNPEAYNTPIEYMEALRYDQYDRWSTMLTKEEYESYFEEGEMVGYGFSVIADQSGKIWIAFVYQNTNAARNGVKRSWRLAKIDGQTVTTSTFGSLIGAPRINKTGEFVFINEQGSEVNVTLTMEVITLTPVLHAEVIPQGDSRIGYLVFQDFIETANPEIDDAFTAFRDSGINELIIDLRYNGGGAVSVAEHIIGWILGKNYAGQTYLRYVHNDLLAPFMDTTYSIPVNNNGFDLDRVFFIGTTNSASASELLIKAVEPFIESILAGSATHGKPVGMYAIPIKDYVALPISFKYLNKDFEGDFYTGIPPTIQAADDFHKDFGDREETCLKAILNYIEDDALTIWSAPVSTAAPVLLNPEGRLNQFLKAY